MDNTRHTTLISRNVIVGITAAVGVGCLTFYAWNRWWRIQKVDRAGISKYTSASSQQVLSMGQGQSVPAITPFGRSSSGYSPIDAGVSTNEDWSITVNPHDETETSCIPINNTSNVQMQQNDRGRFKRVIFRSRMEDGDGPSDNGNVTSPDHIDNHSTSGCVITNQPSAVSSSTTGPIVTNLRLADKLKGFSNEEYQNTLQGTLNRLYGSTKILTVNEAKCLTLLLQQKSPDTLLKTLTTSSNLAAFTINQDLLREQGAVELLVKLLNDTSLSDSTQVMLVQCVGNMAVNQTNNGLLQCCVPRIIELLSSTASSELQRVMCVQALTNLSVDTNGNYTNVYASVLPLLYQRLWSHTGVNIATLRLLVNLSCISSMIPYLLAAETPKDLYQLINDNTSDDLLVRATAFLFYLASNVDTLSIDEREVRTKCDEIQCNYEKSAYFGLFRDTNLQRFYEGVQKLRNHQNEEVRERAARISRHLASILENVKANG